MSFRPIYSFRQLTVKNRWRLQSLLWDFRSHICGGPATAFQYSLSLPTDWIICKYGFLVWLNQWWSCSTLVKCSFQASGKPRSSGFHSWEQLSVIGEYAGMFVKLTHTHTFMRNIPELAEIYLMTLFHKLSSKFTANIIENQLPSRMQNYSHSVYCYTKNNVFIV